MGKYKGIDISHYQGVVDFKKVKSNGYQFVIAKVSQKQGKDSKFETNYSNCHNVIPFGAYIYNVAKNVAEAKAEANFAVAQIKGKKLECGVWLDMEDSSLAGLGKTALNNIIKTEADIIAKAGFRVGIYCNNYWYETILDKSLRKEYPFWIARYPANDTGAEVSSLTPQGKTGVVAWQYSSKGKVLGITGNVDLDTAFVDLAKLMSGTTTNIVTTNATQGTTVSSNAIVVTPLNIIKGDVNQFAQIVRNIKLALNTDYGLKFNTTLASVDDVLLTNLGNIVLSTAIYKPNITYALQQLLKWWGFSVSTDGIYGQETEKVVINFKTCFGFTEKNGTTTKAFWEKVLGK